MTVKQLIEDLQQLDPTMEVLMSKDEEGNRITNFSGWATGYWDDEGGEFTEEDDKEEWLDPVPEDNSVVLFPSY